MNLMHTIWCLCAVLFNWFYSDILRCLANSEMLWKFASCVLSFSVSENKVGPVMKNWLDLNSFNFAS